MQKRRRGKFSIDGNLIGETGPKVLYGTLEPPLSGGIFAVSRPGRFYVEREC
jgi:hypothetical protein